MGGGGEFDYTVGENHSKISLVFQFNKVNKWTIKYSAQRGFIRICKAHQNNCFLTRFHTPLPPANTIILEYTIIILHFDH